MVTRKRGRQEMEVDDTPAAMPAEPSTLYRLRNMWEFASLMQYIFFFGRAVKIDDDFDIEDLETECLKPVPSPKLAEIGLAMLKYVSSHKGLTPEIFDEYARRQFVAKAPQRNPFGIEEDPLKFNDFDVFTKIRVLQQLSVWTLGNADRIREKMAEKDNEQTSWRIEPFGWDTEDRIYFLLDDDRLYRRTDPPIPEPPKKKAKAKPKKSKSTRSSKRRKLSTPLTEDGLDDDEEDAVAEEVAETVQPTDSPDPDTFGGMKWECIAVSLEEYQAIIESLKGSRDVNDKQLRKRLVDDVLPVMLGKAEEQARKEARRARERENEMKLLSAKRSSRIATKLDKKKEEEAAAEAERKRREDLATARKLEQRAQKAEQDRESRMMTREQRLQERESKRILHEEELRKLEEDSKKVEQNEARLSERHLRAEMQRRQKELEQLQEEETWYLDCSVCHEYGQNRDDGREIIACDKCGVWQHLECHGLRSEDAAKEDFHFLCETCKKPKQKLAPLKLRFGPSSSPRSDTAMPDYTNGIAANGTGHAGSAVNARPLAAVEIPAPPKTPLPNGALNGPSLSPQGQSAGPPGSFGYHHPSQYPGPVAGTVPNSGLSALIASTQSNRNTPQAVNPYTNGSPSHPLVNGASTSKGSPATNGAYLLNGSRPPSAHQPIHHNPFANSFGTQRPTSSHQPPSTSPYQSPVKRQSLSPQQNRQTPLYYAQAPYSSPKTSFPTPQQQPPTQFPQKSSPPRQQASPFPAMGAVPSPSIAPPTKQLSSPPPTSSNGSTAQLLPSVAAGISPEKHEVASQPSLQAGVGGQASLLPPVSLSPKPSQQILDPPVKQPTPEKLRMANVDGQ